MSEQRGVKEADRLAQRSDQVTFVAATLSTAVSVGLVSAPQTRCSTAGSTSALAAWLALRKRSGSIGDWHGHRGLQAVPAGAQRLMSPPQKVVPRVCPPVRPRDQGLGCQLAPFLHPPPQRLAGLRAFVF